MAQTTRAAVLLALASYAAGQGPPSGFGGNGGGNSGGNPYANGGGSSSNGPGGNSSSESFFKHRSVIITAHAVLATLAFGFLFPVGGILIRLGSFKGLWIAHAAIQVLGWIFYLAAFGLGVGMAMHIPTTSIHNAHPIIGIVLFIILLLQPVLGLLHHFMFRKHSRRVVWSYGHIWLGRILITVGIINGGLGLQLAKRTRFFAPSTGVIAGYSVAALIMWLLYVASAVWGERKRSRAQNNSHGAADKEIRMDNVGGDYSKVDRSGERYA